MPRQVTFLMTLAALALAGCGEGGLRAWFQNEPDVETLEEIEIPVAAEIRPLIADVTALVVEKRPGGIILRATGLPPTQGWHSAALVASEEASSASTLGFTFRAIPPVEPMAVSTVQSRELTVAVYLSDTELAGVRDFRVVGARSARTARR